VAFRFSTGLKRALGTLLFSAMIAAYFGWRGRLENATGIEAARVAEVDPDVDLSPLHVEDWICASPHPLGRPPCRARLRCGDLLLIDCNSVADGPAYYVNWKTHALVGTSGGLCKSGVCTGAPKEWSCSRRW
jgi:hypothetical protein